MRSFIRQLARGVPQIRRVLESRDAALAERDAALAGRDAALAGRDAALARHDALLAERDALLAGRDAAQAARDALLAERDAAAAAQSRRGQHVIEALLAAARPDSYLHVTLNGAALDLPVETLRTMSHCLHVQADRRIELWVEDTHMQWMAAQLRPGGCLLDVGAATGATALPLAQRFGRDLRIIAFEPSPTARALLQRSLARNGLDWVEVRPCAVSDQAGMAEFREYAADDSGQTPWQPEASSLLGTHMTGAPSRLIEVQVVTLDEELGTAALDGGPVMVKVDVEGFEAFVLRGAAALIRRRRPFFSIDIHVDPFGDGQATTETAVRGLLEPAGYRCERLNHVLLCSPA